MDSSQPKAQGMCPLGMEMDNVILFPPDKPPEGKDRPQIEVVPHPDGKCRNPYPPDFPGQEPFWMAKEMVLVPTKGEVFEETQDLGLPTSPSSLWVHMKNLNRTAISAHALYFPAPTAQVLLA